MNEKSILMSFRSATRDLYRELCVKWNRKNMHKCEHVTHLYLHLLFSDFYSAITAGRRKAWDQAGRQKTGTDIIAKSFFTIRCDQILLTRAFKCKYADQVTLNHVFLSGKH